MTKPDETPDLNLWVVPVYQEEKKPNLYDYAICKYCNEIRMNHDEELKCLFDSSTFAQKIDPNFKKFEEDMEQCLLNASISASSQK